MTSDEQKLLDDMVDTMVAREGIGLAAPQVGIAKRAIVARPPECEVIQLINPEIVERTAETVIGTEGCLSVPGFQGDVERHFAIRVKGKGADGKPVELELLDFPARVIQHEIDHLDGKLFIDRAIPDSLQSVDYEDDPETGEETAVLTPVTLEEIRRFFAQQMRTSS
ncbi:MAG: peptide deformylase [Armatimonadetes bacterium CG2_30_59_28]|nr:MAG: peptide deformylase [Armatimonadetes bacterium CG2_30_59_28]